MLASPTDAAKRGSQVCFAHPEAFAIMQALIARGVIGDFRAPDILRFGFTPLYTRFVDVWDAVDRLHHIMASGASDKNLNVTDFAAVLAVIQSAGVPVITLAGDFGFARSSAAILAQAGFAEFVTDSPENYVRKAVDLAATGVQGHRQAMRDTMRNSALMDEAAFVRRLEDDYRRIIAA